MRHNLILRCAGMLWLVLASLLLQACPWIDRFTLDLMVTPGASGMVNATPDRCIYAAGSVVSLAATPADGWRFDHWEGPVADPAVPVTTVTVNGNTEVTAHFAESAQPGEASVSREVNTEGRIPETVLLTIPGGSRLDVPEGTNFALLEMDYAEGILSLVLRDRTLSDLLPTSFTNWLWAFDVIVAREGEEGEFLITSLSDESVVDPEYVAAGALFSAPLGDYGITEGTQVDLYRLEAPAKETLQSWRHVARSTVESDGTAAFPIVRTGRYAIGRRPVVETSVALDLGAAPLHDCVVEAETPMDRVKVIEASTAEIFNAWVFTNIPPGQMPETTDWVVYSGDEPCMGRLENYGRRFRVRSPYANAFSAEYGLQGEKQDRVAMTGPYEVDANGNPAATPLENPYTQCSRVFAAEVRVLVLSRAGDYGLFQNEVIIPLRAEFDTGGEITSNVRIGWFKKLEEGYYAEVWVHTDQCTQNVANAIPLLQEEGVSVGEMRGRLLYIVDWRGGGPYVAVYSVVAHNTGLGIRFYDPYWKLEGGIIDEHSLGGPNNNILKLVDMEYDCIHDTFWVIKADENGIFNLFRYDKPIYNYGDRPPDARINFPTFALRQLYADPEYDRLYVHTSGSPDEDGDGLRVYANASTAPFLENRVTHISFRYPDEPGPSALLFEHILPVGNTLYLLDDITANSDGLNVFSYALSSTDFGARFQAWASFGGERTAPITKGVFSRRNNILYTATDKEWNGHTSIYAVDAPSSWQSAWIVDAETGNGYWTPDAPSYRAIRWANPGTVWDIDVVEGDQEILAVANAPGLNQGEILLFNNANTAAGDLEPFYRLVLTHGNQRVELINPPSPQESR